MVKSSAASTRATIYLLHGWSVNQLNKNKWQPLIDQLAALGVKTVFLPIPGLTAPLNEVWDLPDFINWLAKSLPNQPVILLGHSFGGQLAAAFAARYSSRVDKLILIDSSGVRDHSFFAVTKRTIFLLMAKVGKLLFKNEKLRKFLYRAAREQDYLNAPPLLRRSMSNILDAEIGAELASIKCETLLIWGQNDRVTPLWLGKFFHRQISKSKLRVIDEARHSPQFTHTQQVAQLVADFVN
jgi:pimeloyl-ACP methyl ester carboxylesterase